MRLIKIMLGLTVFFLALPGVAEEIIYFKTGQTLPIRTHEFREGMVRVDLGDNAMMEFPEFTIDRIEVAGKHVLLKRSYLTGVNRLVPSPQGSFPVQGTRRPQDREPLPIPNAQPSPIKTDPRTGLAGYFRNGHRAAANNRMIQVTGDMKALGNNPITRGAGDTYTGTTRMGNRHVLGGLTPYRGNAAARNPNMPQKTSVVMKYTAPTKANAAQPQDDSDNR